MRATQGMHHKLLADSLSRGCRCPGNVLPFHSRIKHGVEPSPRLPIACSAGQVDVVAPAATKTNRRDLLLALSLFGACHLAPGKVSAALVEEDVSQRVFDSAADSVVTITNSRQQGDQVVDDAAGSGFVWDSRGYIVTNYHCIQGPLRDISGNEFVLVKLGSSMERQESYRANIVGTDSSNDLAVLQIDAPAAKLKPIKVGTSVDLKVGQSVFAIGNPFGLSKTLTAGVVSGLNRGIPTPGGSIATRAIQTDAAVSSGNSGGPLLDSSARLVGVSTATFTSNKAKGRGSGVNFAVSVDTVLQVVPNLIVYGNASGKGVSARRG